MRYALLIYVDENPSVEWTDEQRQTEGAAYGRFTKEIANRGISQGGEPLQSTATATTVRVRDGDVLTTDGPFAETKEALGGFYLVDCKDLDEAIEVASKIPSATHGSIEVRPIMELPGEPAQG
jgi:hypothetical protein